MTILLVRAATEDEARGEWLRYEANTRFSAVLSSEEKSIIALADYHNSVHNAKRVEMFRRLRGTFFDEIPRWGVRKWRLYSVDDDQLVSRFEIAHDIHYRNKLAPQTGHLDEAARNLIENPQLAADYQEILKLGALFRNPQMKVEGMVALIIKSRWELWEGCHRALGLACAVVRAGRSPAPRRLHFAYVGEP